MPDPDLIELFVLPLERLQLRYLITGSVAAMLYGEPRVTHDIDFAIFLRVQDASRFPEAYPSADFYVPPPETIIAEIDRTHGGHFNVIHSTTGLKADFYPASFDDFNAWAFRNVRKYDFKNSPVRLAPPEYVIVRKLEFFREGGSDKHLRDIRSMLKISGDQIDRGVLMDWVQRQGVEAQWKLVEG